MMRRLHKNSKNRGSYLKNKYERYCVDPEGACLLTVLIAYDKPRLWMNIHYYAPWLTLTGLQCTLRCTHCAGTGSILVKVQCQVLNR